MLVDKKKLGAFVENARSKSKAESTEEPSFKAFTGAKPMKDDDTEPFDLDAKDSDWIKELKDKDEVDDEDLYLGPEEDEED